MITEKLLSAFAPKCNAPVHAYALESARQRSTVNTPARLAHFLGQIFVETAGLTRMEENLHYTSPERLDAVFSAVKGKDDARALIRLGQIAIANRVYANRLGNSDESSGDGWRYRGSGYKQLTGRDNYAHIGKLIGMNLVGDPEQAREHVTAAKIAFAFWDAHACSKLADAGNVDRITAIINGPAKLGLAERKVATQRALELLSKEDWT